MRTKKQSTPTAESVLLRIADEIDPNTSVIPSKTYSEIAAELRVMAQAFAGLREAKSNPFRDAAVELARDILRNDGTKLSFTQLRNLCRLILRLAGVKVRKC